MSGNIYYNTRLCNGQTFLDYVKGVYDRHYFSNHHVLAAELEKCLSQKTGMEHNITYMNSSISVITLLHIYGINKSSRILLSPGVITYDWVINSIMYLDIPYVEYDDQETDEICSVAFLLESDIVEFNIDASRFERVIVLPTSFNCRLFNTKQAIIFDMSIETEFALDSGAFVSLNEADTAHKLRWMRSSYGRTGHVEVPINSNGRFSEIQAARALVFLTEENCNIDNRFVNNKVFSSISNIKFKYKLHSGVLSPGFLYIYYDVNINHKTQDVTQLFNDKIKLTRCEKHNALIIRLPYKFSEIEALLNCINEYS